MRANKHPRSACLGCLARPLLLPRSSTVVRDWKQSRAAKVPLSSSVGRFPLSFSWEEKHPEGLTDKKKRGVASVSDAAGGTHFKRCHHHKVLLLHLNLPPLQVTTLISRLPSFRRARARDRLLQRALPGVAVGGEAGGREWEGRGRGQLAVARPLVGGRVHHGVRRQNEVSSVRNMERETISF